jgi:hypothetical protein
MNKLNLTTNGKIFPIWILHHFKKFKLDILNIPLIQIFYGYELIPGGFDGLNKQPQEFFNKIKGS